MGDLDRDIGDLQARTAALEKWVHDIDGKLDRLLEAAAMGRGAWWAIIKIGGIAVAVTAAAGWIFDHLKRG